MYAPPRRSRHLSNWDLRNKYLSCRLTRQEWEPRDGTPPLHQVRPRVETGTNGPLELVIGGSSFAPDVVRREERASFPERENEDVVFS